MEAPATGGRLEAVIGRRNTGQSSRVGSRRDLTESRLDSLPRDAHKLRDPSLARLSGVWLACLDGIKPVHDPNRTRGCCSGERIQEEISPCNKSASLQSWPSSHSASPLVTPSEDITDQSLVMCPARCKDNEQSQVCSPQYACICVSLGASLTSGRLLSHTRHQLVQ